MIAHRKRSFAHGIVFSDKPLNPGEVFLLEIVQNEGGWSGHLRFGLTSIDPNNKNIAVPQYALPDLANMSPSWIFAVPNNFDYDTQSSSRRREQDSVIPEQYRPDNSSQASPLRPPRNTVQSTNGLNAHVLSNFNDAVPTEEFFEEPEVDFYDTEEFHDEDSRVAADRFSRLNLKTNVKPNTLPTDVGAQLGVTYVVNNEGNGEMHFIFNGVDQGVYASDIPILNNQPIFAIADVYGTTKKLRVIQVGAMNSLKNACRETILNQVERNNVKKLPLPGRLKNYLLGMN